MGVKIMVWFEIISNETFESVFGKIEKGEVLETTEQRDLSECKRYVRRQYGPDGQNINVKIRIL